MACGGGSGGGEVFGFSADDIEGRRLKASVDKQESAAEQRGLGGPDEYEAQRTRYHQRTMEYHGPLDMIATFMDANSVARMLNMSLVHEHRSGFNGSYTFLKKDKR